jgi:hypothetical protein
MKKVKQEGGAGLQEWLSYQSRTRATIQPETDIIDWDEGIEVQEEWLPRELCEQRLREEAERKLAPDIKSAPVASVPPPLEVATLPIAGAALVVEVEDVPLTAPAAAGPSQPATTGEQQPETKELSARESAPREFRSKAAAPTQFEADDLVSAVPAFHH